MLLQFAVENYRSFNSEVVLNMAPAKSRIHKDHVLTSDDDEKIKALPFAVFYGANASGKSNLIKAISFARDFIINGTRGDDGIDTVPFRLDDKTVDQPSKFEFVFKHEGILYSYGFKTTTRLVSEEWLFAEPGKGKKEVKVFERITKNDKTKVVTGNYLNNRGGDEKKRLQFVAEGTRPNQLFLTEAIERNVEKLKPVMQWFRNHIRIILPESEYLQLIERSRSDKKFVSFLETLLKQADVGIQGVSTISEPLDLERQFPEMSPKDKKELHDYIEKGMNVNLTNGSKMFCVSAENQKNNPLLVTLKMQHKVNNKQIIEFDAGDESDGTLRMMHLAPPILGLTQDERLVIIDELDRSLHPALCRYFVDAFLKTSLSTKSRAQLIVTTHQTCLLDLELLRRDEIWFVEKDQEGASRLTSLAEFKPREDLKIDKGYLQGRFGAIPFLGDPRKLIQ